MGGLCQYQFHRKRLAGQGANSGVFPRFLEKLQAGLTLTFSEKFFREKGFRDGNNTPLDSTTRYSSTNMRNA
jgi:hypothetical protein